MIRLLALFALILGSDQLTKYLVRANLEGSHAYLGGLVTFEHAQNSGAFLSMGAGLGDDARYWIFTVGVGIFLAFVAWTLRKPHDPWTKTGLVLLLAGGIGNLIDRALFGSVTDFMLMQLGPLRTGVFNIADMAIMAGVVLLILAPRAPKSKQAEADQHHA